MNKNIFFMIVVILPQLAIGSELITAIRNTNSVLAKQLIAEKKDINTQDKWGWTPLMWAASKGDVELCKSLITNGAAVDVKDREGIAILDYLCGQHAFGLDADVKKQLIKLLTEAQRKQAGQTIIIDKSALKEQEYKNAVEALKAGIEKNGVGKINTQDEMGKTPLMEFSADGNIKACELLLKNGAKVNIKDKKGRTAIDYACTHLKHPDDKLKNDMISLLKAYDK